MIRNIQKKKKTQRRPIMLPSTMSIGGGGVAQESAEYMIKSSSGNQTQLLAEKRN